MSIILSHPTQKIKGKVYLTASKSESNRALIIQALCDDKFDIENLSNSDDTVVLANLLTQDCHFERSRRIDNDQGTLSVGLAGTAMRFLTAYLAIRNKDVVLTGAQRMTERPIKALVDALKELGADISYQEKEDYPPLKINGRKLTGDKVMIDGGISSQYISALLMIAPKLDKGLTIEIRGEIISKPYVNMTIVMMRYFGAKVKWNGNSIVVDKGNYKPKDFLIEADWSAASYWYSMVALAKEADVTLYGLKQESLQGDSVVREIYKNFGVDTEFIKGGIRLTKNPIINYQLSIINFKDCPDIAQTVAVTCAALNVKVRLTGLKTLRIKETDRIAALQTELNKLGYHVEVEGDDILINTSLQNFCHPERSRRANKNNCIKTYNDHRMAMAFAPLSLLNSITIEKENVVAKSYPNFWEDLESFDVEVGH